MKCYTTQAQSTFGTLENKSLPQSPEAEAIIKSVALPVTLYTGMADVNIPVFEIKGKSLSIPISLQYNYNGFKPSETANRVGLGWNLQGGGAVTRIVKGRVDYEDLNVIQEYDKTVDINLLSIKQTVVRNIAEGYVDGEPDIYVFSAPQLSGKFILHQGHAFMFPHQNIRIQRWNGGFLITAENGDRYFFDAPETTGQAKQFPGSLPVPEHESGWFLTKIVSANLTDTISYEYDESSYFRQPPFVDRYTITDATANSGQGVSHYWEKTSGAGTGVTTQILNKIKYKNTIIQFNPGETRTDAMAAEARLSSIIITQNGNLSVPSYTLLLTHDYQNSKLNLRKVTIVDELDSTHNQNYKFDYEDGLGSGASKYDWINIERSVDKWGYYNGASNGNRMLFTSEEIPNSSYQYGDRSTVFSFCRTNVMKRMIPPTGGQILFDYELNGINAPGLRVKRILFFDDINNPIPSSTKKYTYGGLSSYILPGMAISEVKRRDGLCNNISVLDKIDLDFQYGPPTTANDLLTNPFYYSSVTESTQSPQLSGITEFQFHSYDELDPTVNLYQKTEKIFKNNTFVPIKQITYADTLITKIILAATTATLSEVIGSTPPWCYLPPTPDPTQAVEGLEKIYHAEPYVLTSAYTRRKSAMETTWDENGQNPVVVSTNYFYDNPDHNYATRIITQNSKGQLLTTYSKYPLDYLPSSIMSRATLDANYYLNKVQTMQTYSSCYNSLFSALAPYQPYSSHVTSFTSIANSYHCEDNFITNSTNVIANRNAAWTQYYSSISAARNASAVARDKALYAMIEKNIFSPVVETYSTIQMNGNEYLTAAKMNEFNLIASDIGEASPMLTKVNQVEVKGSVLKNDFRTNPDSYYKAQSEFTYDAKINLISQHKINDKEESFLWSDDNQQVIAASSSASQNMAYTSFEEGESGNWNGINPAMIQATGGLTGKRFYQQTGFSLSKSGLLANTVYSLSYWSKSGPYSIAGTQSGYPRQHKSVMIGGSSWTLYEHLIKAQSTITILGSGGIDEIRLRPQYSEMTSYTYDDIEQLTSQTDMRNQITFFEYDGLARLQQIRDQDKNIVKRFDYKYAPTPVDNQTGCISMVPIWQNTSTPFRCRIIDGLLTGAQENEQIDINPCSATFNIIQWNITGANLNGCPPACEYSDCVGNGPEYRCVAGTCEQGIKIYTDTYTDDRGYVCVFHYEWSDMWSENFEEVNDEPCNND